MCALAKIHQVISKSAFTFDLTFPKNTAQGNGKVPSHANICQLFDNSRHCGPPYPGFGYQVSSRRISLTLRHFYDAYSSGLVLHSSHKFSESDVALLLKSGPIRCAAVSQDFRYLLTSGDDKLLKLWAVDGLKLLSER
jgi:WD40 repeat protein